jgi:hypothetical protein
MKMICIDATPPHGYPISPLIEGDSYTIQRTEPTPKGECYILNETLDWQEMHMIAFEKRRFIHMSEIDETTFKRNYNKEPQLK